MKLALASLIVLLGNSQRVFPFSVNLAFFANIFNFFRPIFHFLRVFTLSLSIFCFHYCLCKSVWFCFHLLRNVESIIISFIIFAKKFILYTDASFLQKLQFFYCLLRLANTLFSFTSSSYYPLSVFFLLLSVNSD